MDGTDSFVTSQKFLIEAVDVTFTDKDGDVITTKTYPIFKNEMGSKYIIICSENGEQRRFYIGGLLTDEDIRFAQRLAKKPDK